MTPRFLGRRIGPWACLAALASVAGVSVTAYGLARAVTEARRAADRSVTV